MEEEEDQIVADVSEETPDAALPDQLGSLYAEGSASPSKWEKTLAKIIPAIISIRLIAVRSFDTDHQGASQASGFIVDKERGIILSNRHVVHPGPVLAEGIFSQSKEEIKLIPIYRDPVHDFGFFKFNVKEIKYMELVEIPLAPEKARVGIDIRVVGNNSGERLSILGGTLARLDRKAPQYGSGKYNVYYQAASMTSGGSSGSPVVNDEGEAIALNAGGATSSASSFFLPLDRVVRVLKLLQQDLPVPRGTLQTIFKFSPFDEVKRLGLKTEIEESVRKEFPGNTGMLAISQVIPKGPGDTILEEGDIIIKINDGWMLKFVALEELMDTSVGKPIKFLVQRGSDLKELTVVVQDLHAITPHSYIEVGGGILNTLSYQMAKSYMVPVGGVFVAGAGYMLGLAGVSRKCIIKALNNIPTPDIPSFIAAVNTLRDGERVPIRYFHLTDINKEKLALVPIDRHWHGFRVAERDDTTGLWNYTQLPDCIGKAVFEPHTATPISLDESLGPGRIVVPSLVHVEFHLPFKVDGVVHQDHSGVGLIVDAERGLVVVDRHAIPTFIGDVLLTFANSIFVPARILYIHQIYNFAIVEYNPELLGKTPVASATLSDRELLQGDSVYLICLTKSYQPLVRKTIVTNVRQFYVAEPIPPSYRAMNVEGIELENPISQGGVLTDETGRIQAIYAAYTKHAAKGRNEFHMGLTVSVVKPILDRLKEAMAVHGGWNPSDPNGSDIRKLLSGFRPVYGLEVELTYAQVAHTRLLGLSDEWVKRIENTHLSRRNVLLIRRLTSGTAASTLLKEGDVVLAIDGEPVTTFENVMKNVDKTEIQMTILRDKNEMNVTVPQTLLEHSCTTRIVGWAGAIFQMPPKAIYQQLKIVPKGVLCSVVYDGSPSQLYQLQPLSWVTEIDGKEISNLDDFLEAVRSIPSGSFARLRLVNFNRFVKVIALRTDSHYFGTWEIKWASGGEGGGGWGGLWRYE
ncbi:serine protease [Phlyctochytrium planicorne]|nr:serine protease [Phlyctochytrium planicorne]